MRQINSKNPNGIDAKKYIKKSFGLFEYNCVTVIVKYSTSPSITEKRMNLSEILNDFDYLHENGYVCTTHVIGGIAQHFMFSFKHKEKDEVVYYEFNFFKNSKIKSWIN